MVSKNTNTSILINKHFITLLLLLFWGCSSVQPLHHRMTKDEILSFYIDVFSSNNCFSGKYSEYSYHYIDTVFNCSYMGDSLYFEDEYTQLSCLWFFPHSQDEPFTTDMLPPYVIEKNGRLFLTYDEKWGPGHTDVEKILRDRGHYFANDNDEWFILHSMIRRFGELEKATFFYFTRDNPKRYKIIRTCNSMKPPKFKGVSYIHREIKAESEAELPRHR